MVKRLNINVGVIRGYIRGLGDVGAKRKRVRLPMPRTGVDVTA
jgi:hypothetical protein